MIGDYGLTGIGMGPNTFAELYPAYALTGATKGVYHSQMLYLELILETGALGFFSFMWFWLREIKTPPSTGQNARVPSALQEIPGEGAPAPAARRSRNTHGRPPGADVRRNAGSTGGPAHTPPEFAGPPAGRESAHRTPLVLRRAGIDARLTDGGTHNAVGADNHIVADGHPRTE